MTHQTSNKAFLMGGIATSFIVASMLSVYPLCMSLAALRPMFMVITLAFWLLYRPEILGVFTAFIIGLIADLLLGTHLGHQAFSAVVMTLTIRLILRLSRELTMQYAWGAITISLTVYQMVLWILQSFLHGFIWAGFGSLVMSVAIFPMLWKPLYWVHSQLKERAY